MNEKRYFNGNEKLALFLCADGKCSSCGKSLEKGWHADHIKPYSKKGETDVINGQALCPECNLKKGSRMSLELRDWQKELEETYLKNNQKDFLLTALPGAGKTIGSLNLVNKLMNDLRIDGIIIVTPTDHLKIQWKDDAHESFNIELYPDFVSKDGLWPKSFHGLCVTYQQVAMGPLIFRKTCADRRMMVIFDEIHHCGDRKSWGDGIKVAFEYAERRLSLSGTPFRSDNSSIPFVVYVNGVCRSDFSYDYPRAIHDGVIRLVAFNHYDGKLEWLNGEGEKQKASFSDEVNQPDSRARLKTALDPNLGWLHSLIVDADKQLDELRAGDLNTVADQNAGGLIVAKDIMHAYAIAKNIFKNRLPVIVASKDNNGQIDAEASQKIKKFRESTDKWIIAVNMVSEGVDIKRLRVLVYATNVSTELYFRQVVGRIVRHEDEDDNLAYCFLPSDQTLIEYAKKITEAQLHAIEGEQREDKEGPKERIEREERQSIIPLYSSDAELDLINIEGQGYQRAMIDKVRTASERYGVHPAIFLKIYNESGLNSFSPQDDIPKPKMERPLADEVKLLRKCAHSLAFSLACRLKTDVSLINTEWLKMGGKPQKANDPDDLKRKIEWLNAEIKSTRIE